MTSSYDTIVLGLGAMGSSAAYHLSQVGRKVLGLEQFSCAHDRGSSHGKSRLIRQAYFEHPDYVPLLKRSYELWDDLSKKTGRPLLHRTGVVIYGPEKGGKVLPGVRKSSHEYKIPVEEYTRAKARERFPNLAVPEGFVGIFEPGAGFLEVENCVRSYCEMAAKFGADLHFEETVINWSAFDDHVVVKTDRGEYTGSSLVICAGAWSGKLLGDFGMALKVQRVPLFWFEADSLFSEEKGFPCFAYDMPYGFIYGFPWKKGEGIKVAPHIPGAVVSDPTHLDRQPTKAELAPVLRCLEECIPAIRREVMHQAMCMYTMSPDSHFILDLHPQYKNVSIACGFSGHGFKFASVVGEVLSELAIHRKTKYPISFLKVRAA